MDVNDFRPPNAPDNPQFWVLSELILRMDRGIETENKSLDDVVREVTGDLIDAETINYMAMQRAFRPLGIRTVADMKGREQLVMLLSAMWLEGCTVGVAARDDLQEAAQ